MSRRRGSSLGGGISTSIFLRSQGRQALVRQCRFAGSQRLPKIRTYRTDIKDGKCGIVQKICSSLKNFCHCIYKAIPKKEYTGKVNEGHANRISVPPQRTRLRIMSSSLVVVVVLAASSVIRGILKKSSLPKACILTLGRTRVPSSRQSKTSKRQSGEEGGEKKMQSRKIARKRSLGIAPPSTKPMGSMHLPASKDSKGRARSKGTRMKDHL